MALATLYRIQVGVC